jgi:hypothetical protein
LAKLAVKSIHEFKEVNIVGILTFGVIFLSLIFFGMFAGWVWGVVE